MIEGDVAGIWTTEIEIPEGGELSFRILADGDTNAVIGPEVTTKTKTDPIVGPKPGLTSDWVVKGKEGSIVVVEFFAPADPKLKALRSITWINSTTGGE